MNYLVAIMTERNTLFSGVKPSSPKIINKMKESCTQYSKIFGGTYKVVRFIQTPKGMRRV